METKRRRLVADTADDLQHILFGDMEQDVAENDETNQAVVPVEKVEPDNVESYSDSDKDSMDEFIVRDTNDDKEHRFIQSYTDRYGEDVGETLNDVIAVFGDLRILDMYSRDASRISTTAPIESQFGEDELRAEFATDSDTLIAQTDCSERVQERMGTDKAMEALLAFERNDIEQIEKYESEWAVEARWLYVVLRERAIRMERGSSDWTLWTPCEMSDPDKVADLPLNPDHSALTDLTSDQSASGVISRIHVFLRDLKGRGFDPHYIWNSMGRAKYVWFLNLDDLIQIQMLDATEWSSSLGPKYSRLSSKLTDMYSEIDDYLQNNEHHDSMADSIRIELANLKSELNFFASQEGMTCDFGLQIDDFALSLSVEIDPIWVYIKSKVPRIDESALVPVDPMDEASATKSTGRKLRRPAGSSTSLVSQIIGASLHETLLPLISLSPREIGENLQIGARVHKGPEMDHPPREPAPAIRQLLVEYLSTSVAANGKVRSWFRHQVRSRAVVSTHPVGDLACTDFMYPVRRVCFRPVGELWGTEVYLAMHSLASRGDISLDLLLLDDGGRIVPESDMDEMVIARNVELRKEELGSSAGVADNNPMLHDLMYHMKPEVFDADWLTALRLTVGQAIVTKLTKSLKDELLRDLLVDNLVVAGSKVSREFQKLACMQSVRGKLTPLGASLGARDLRNVHDRRVVWELVSRQLKSAHATVMVAVVEKLSNGSRAHLLIVNAKGDTVENVHLDHLLSKWAPKYSSDYSRAQQMIKDHFPSVIIVGADDWKSRTLFAELGKAAQWVYQEQDSNGKYIDTDASKYLECPEVFLSTLVSSGDPVARALSVARFHQCPLAELLVASPDLHPLQAYIGQSVMEQYMHVAATKIVALTGVDLNDALGSESRSKLLEFVPGLGPRKARLLRENADATLRGIADEEDLDKNKTRMARLEEILGNRVAQSAQPFLKLQPLLERIVQGICDNEYDDDEDDDESSSSSSDSSSDSSDDDVPNPEPVVAEGDWAKPVEEPEWTKDAEGNWVKSGEPKAAEWTKDAEGNWVKPGKAASAEWTKDTDGNWVKPDDSSKPKSNGWELSYFGVPSKYFKDFGAVFDYCRFAKECWPVVREMFPDDSVLFDKMGSSLEEPESLTELIDMIFAADELPAHLSDPEVDIASLKLGAQSVITNLLLVEIAAPFALSWRPWTGSSAMAVFYACVHENPSEFNLWTVVTASVKEASKDTVKVSEVGTGIDGILTKGYQDYRTKYYEGDSVCCRISKIDFTKFSLGFTTEPVSGVEIEKFRKKHFVCCSQDFDKLKIGLGKVQPLAVSDESRTVLKTRRIIKHDSYFEVSHATAVQKLAECPIGEVIFRPSSSHPGQYFGMIKIKALSESVDPSREDWIKTFRFVESITSRFRLVDTNEEFEEFDQMKVLFVERYLNKLHELMAHPKFRPESIDRVANLVKAKSMANNGNVAYSFVMDNRREAAGNALLLWTDGDRVYQDPIDISNRGFKWWTKGPYLALSGLISWWKMGGYRERHALIAEYQLAKGAPSNDKEAKDDGWKTGSDWNKKDSWAEKGGSDWNKKDSWPDKKSDWGMKDSWTDKGGSSDWGKRDNWTDKGSDWNKKDSWSEKSKPQWDMKDSMPETSKPQWDMKDSWPTDWAKKDSGAKTDSWEPASSSTQWDKQKW